MTTKPHRATRRNRVQKPLVFLWIAIALLTAGVIAGLVMVVGPAPPKHITLAGGAPGGAYHAFAAKYRDALKIQGVTVDVIDTAGSVENLELLGSGKADVAFVQSGTHDLVDLDDKLRGIASLYYEPLWIFQKGENEVTQLSAMRGKRLAIGAPRSGTQTVVKKVLSLNGLDESNTEMLPLAMQDAADAVLKGEVDYAFFVASPQAEVVKKLMTSPETRLVGIRRHKAYVRNVLFVKNVEIAEGTFDLRQNFPQKDIVVLSTLATLVCKKELHPALVELLSRTARELHSARQLLERGGEFPSPDNLEFAIHEAASDYFQSGPSLLARYMPYWLATLLKKLLLLAIPLITLMIPLMKIAPTVYKAIMRKRIHRFYHDLDQIEESILEAKNQTDFDTCGDELDRLAQQVEVGIEVPTSFRNEEYDLRMHLRHVRKRLEFVRSLPPEQRTT